LCSESISAIQGTLIGPTGQGHKHADKPRPVAHRGAASMMNVSCEGTNILLWVRVCRADTGIGSFTPLISGANWYPDIHLNESKAALLNCSFPVAIN
jgi:hypothetical protein